MVENGGIVLDAKVVLDEKTAGKNRASLSHADILTDNNIMIKIFKKRGFRFTRQDEIYHCELDLSEYEPKGK